MQKEKQIHSNESGSVSGEAKQVGLGSIQLDPYLLVIYRIHGLREQVDYPLKPNSRPLLLRLINMRRYRHHKYFSKGKIRRTPELDPHFQVRWSMYTNFD